jgi:hypothetical protein
MRSQDQNSDGTRHGDASMREFGHLLHTEIQILKELLVPGAEAVET